MSSADGAKVEAVPMPLEGAKDSTAVAVPTTLAPKASRTATSTAETRGGTAAAFVNQYGDKDQVREILQHPQRVPTRTPTIGALELPPATEIVPKPRTYLAKFKYAIAPWKDLIAEFFGTMVLIIFGCGVVSVVVLSGGANGDSNTIYWAWGWAVMMGILVSGGYSGAHLNPAVTLSLFVWRGFPARKVVPYWGAQLLGAFTGAAVVYWNYYPAFVHFNGVTNGGAFVVNGFQTGTQVPTAGVFATYPADFINNGNAFVSEMIGTALLLFVIFATGDAKNAAPTAYGALAVGALIMALGMSWGWLTGYALNPARDFGPRAFSAIVFGPKVFQAYGYYFWVPVVGPLVGAVVGGGLYEIFLMSEADEA
ncbi:aquaporin-3 [Hyaloraphidium curvatum]|nr:aquaporin-3 [Hyaloraphidium curvatum]